MDVQEYIGSQVALREANEQTVAYHNPMLVFAETPEQAQAALLADALRVYPVSRGWHSHRVLSVLFEPLLQRLQEEDPQYDGQIYVASQLASTGPDQPGGGKNANSVAVASARTDADAYILLTKTTIEHFPVSQGWVANSMIYENLRHLRLYRFVHT